MGSEQRKAKQNIMLELQKLDVEADNRELSAKKRRESTNWKKT